MADENRKEDQDLGKIFEESFGFSEQEILADIEKAETSEDFPDFDGAEERIFRKLMERKAGEEKKKSPRPVRLKKKKAALVAALVAVFVLMLGITAIGGKNYFFGVRMTEKGIVLNNDKNLSEPGKLEEAYEEAMPLMGEKLLKMAYLPEKMYFKNLIVSKYSVVFEFEYNGNTIHFVQKCLDKEGSINIESDREKITDTIYNEWLNQDIDLREEILEEKNGQSFSFIIDNAIYYFIGKLNKDEVINIIKNLTYYEKVVTN